MNDLFKKTILFRKKTLLPIWQMPHSDDLIGCSTFQHHFFSRFQDKSKIAIALEIFQNFSVACTVNWNLFHPEKIIRNREIEFKSIISKIFAKHCKKKKKDHWMNDTRVNVLISFKSWTLSVADWDDWWVFFSFLTFCELAVGFFSKLLHFK